jgi:hypothetical protein
MFMREKDSGNKTKKVWTAGKKWKKWEWVEEKG